MTLYALAAADGRLLWGPATWAPRAISAAMRTLGVTVSLGAIPPGAAVPIFDTATPRALPPPPGQHDAEGRPLDPPDPDAITEPGPEPEPVEVAQIVLVADSPAHDPALQLCTYEWDTGEWVLAWRDAATVRTVQEERSRQACRAGILAAAPEADQRNAALAGGQEAADMLALIQSWRDAHAAHKVALAALDEAADLAVYDLAAGWPQEG